VGYVETDSVTLLMAFPFEEGAESEHCTMATETLTQAMDPEQFDRLHEAINSGEAVISVPTPSTVQLSLDHSLLAHLNPRMIRTGEYCLDLEDETQPRGLYVLEPEWECPTARIKENHWIIRFTGACDHKFEADTPRIYELLRNAIATALREAPQRIDPSTLDWVDAETPGSLSAERVWELYHRSHALKGKHMLMHQYFEPWVMQTPNGSARSHDSRGTPLDTTRLREVSQGSVRQRGPSKMLKIVIAAANLAAEALTEELGRYVTATVRDHWFPEKVLANTEADGPPKNPFGQLDPSLCLLRVVTLPGSEMSKPAKLLAKILSSGADPVVCKTVLTNVGTKRTPGAGLMGVSKVTVTSVDVNMQALVAEPGGVRTATCGPWIGGGDFQPVLGDDYWITPQGVTLTPPDSEMFQADFEDELSGLRRALQGATAEGFAEATTGSRVKEASRKLAEAVEEGTVRKLKQKTEEAWVAAGGETKEESRNDTRGHDDEWTEQQARGRQNWDEAEVLIRLTSMGSEMVVRYIDIERWAAGKNLTRDLRISDIARYGVHIGSIPTHLGLGNKVTKDPAISPMCDPDVWIDGRRVRSKQHENAPLATVWKDLLRAERIQLAFTRLRGDDARKSYTICAHPDSCDDDSESDDDEDDEPGAEGDNLAAQLEQNQDDPAWRNLRKVKLTPAVAQFEGSTGTDAPERRASPKRPLDQVDEGDEGAGDEMEGAETAADPPQDEQETGQEEPSEQEQQQGTAAMDE
jgi:hypothetical protein